MAPKLRAPDEVMAPDVMVLAPALMAPEVMFPVLSEVEKRLVLDAVVEKKLVVVALEPVALMKVKFCKVDDPVARKLVVVEKVKREETPVRSPVVFWKVKLAEAPNAPPSLN